MGNDNTNKGNPMNELNQVAELLKKKVTEAFEAGKAAGRQEGVDALLKSIQAGLTPAAPAPAKNKGGRPKGKAKAKKVAKAPAKRKAKGKGGRPKKGFSKNGVKLGRPPGSKTKAKTDPPAVSNGHNPPVPPSIEEAIRTALAPATA